jgi:peptidyl-prolyl cis-trans isomerase SurA
MTRKLLFILMMAAAVLASHNASAEAVVFDRVIVIVNDDVILHSELERRLEAVRAQIRKQGMELPDDKVLREQVLERMILDSIQLQMAERIGIRVSDTELNATIANIASKNGMTLEQFKKKLESEGESFALFREDLRHEIMISRLRQAKVGRRVYISDQEVDDMVRLMEEQGANNVQYRLGHILVAIPETATPDTVKAAREKAANIVRQLKEGADFAKLAIAYSDAQDALQGGDMGWKTINELPTLFAPVAQQLEPGQVADPIRSGSGLHILKLLDKKGGENKTMVRQVKARHILIKPSAILSDEQAKMKLEEIRSQILAGAKFEDLAKEYSEDLGSASQGGDLGWASPDIFTPKFKEMVESLPVGEISKPFRSQFGWHIVQVEGWREADQTEEAKRDRARRILFQRKFEEEVSNWLRQIRAEAYVKMLDQQSS